MLAVPYMYMCLVDKIKQLRSSEPWAELPKLTTNQTDDRTVVVDSTPTTTLRPLYGSVENFSQTDNGASENNNIFTHLFR